MTTEQSSDQPTESRLNDLLDLLKEVPPRDSEAEASTRAKYIAGVDAFLHHGNHLESAGMNQRGGYPDAQRGPKGLIFRHRFAFTSMLVLYTLLIVLFGGAGVTAYAAQTALPGDALYPVKTGLELTQVRLSRDASRQAQLYMNFAERRLDEIALLVAQGRYADIDQATIDFETNVQRAINTLNVVAAGDPSRAQELATQITQALTRYTDILKGMLTVVPDPVKPALEKAILTSESESTGEIEFQGVVESITAEGWMIAGRLVKSSPQTEIKGTIQVGMLVNVHALVSVDGSLTANEIEAADTSTEINANNNSNDEESEAYENENSSGDSANDNHDDDNDNHQQLNSNENQNRNSNRNENSGNDNDDDESKNSNEHDNDNHDNDNHDDDDDVNENHNDNDRNSNNNDNEHEENRNNND